MWHYNFDIILNEKGDRKLELEDFQYFYRYSGKGTDDPITLTKVKEAFRNGKT